MIISLDYARSEDSSMQMNRTNLLSTSCMLLVRSDQGALRSFCLLSYSVQHPLSLAYCSQTQPLRLAALAETYPTETVYSVQIRNSAVSKFLDYGAAISSISQRWALAAHRVPTTFQWQFVVVPKCLWSSRRAKWNLPSPQLITGIP